MRSQAQTQMNTAAARAPSFTPVRAGLLQRKCACGGSPGSIGACAECRKEKLHRRAADQAEPSAVPPIVNEVLRSPGQSLDAATRAFMEPRFGHDFSQVRVHTGAKAAVAQQPMGRAEFDKIMKDRYRVTNIRTGTIQDQPHMDQSQWKAWDPGSSSEVYNWIVEAFVNFDKSFV